MLLHQLSVGQTSTELSQEATASQDHCKSGLTKLDCRNIISTDKTLSEESLFDIVVRRTESQLISIVFTRQPRSCSRAPFLPAIEQEGAGASLAPFFTKFQRGGGFNKKEDSKGKLWCV